MAFEVDIILVLIKKTFLLFHHIIVFREVTQSLNLPLKELREGFND